jgi:hypothetical protein
MASEGANSLVAARKATEEFVNALSRKARPDQWEQLKNVES